MDLIEDKRKISDLTVQEFNAVMRNAIHDAFSDAGLPIESNEEKMAARADLTMIRKLRTTIDATASTIGKAVVTSVVVVCFGFMSWLFTNFLVNK